MGRRKTETREDSSRISLFAKPDNMTLEEWQIALRRQMAEKEQFTIEEFPESYGEYYVRNFNSRSLYKVVYRGSESPWNFCSCMDFKTSQLGTCKHIEAVKRKFPDVHVEMHPYSSIYLSYRGTERKICISIGTDHQEEVKSIARKYFDNSCILKPKSLFVFDKLVKEISSTGAELRCYPDALDFVVGKRDREKRSNILRSRYSSDSSLDCILRTKLYPYQKEGVRFAFTNGKAIIADEMGLGKTIQAICTAEIYRRESLAENIIVVCPTSLKYQWKREIERFTGLEDVLVIEGNPVQRDNQYRAKASYKIVSYQTVCNDIRSSGGMQTDLLIMDEVQRLRNWNTQIAKAIRKIDSSYSIILSGTPLENKLEDLYSIVQLADQFCLGPYYKFRNRHIQTNENGKIRAYINLNEIKNQLSGVLIRRCKRDVDIQLPNRIDKNLLVPMTKEQMELHEEYKSYVSRLVNKWKNYHFLCEQDRRRLLLFLSEMRMVCDSTYILDQKTRFDTKISEAINIVSEVTDSSDEKIVIFSQWERMTRLIVQELDRIGIGYEYLHGGIPSARRKNLIDNFTDNPDVRVFVSTDAGGTGLNLQAASIIINMDLPWNPSVLEQRIARIWRIGQSSSIQVINFISRGTIEEGMIGKLRFKSAMAIGALDNGENTVFASDDNFRKIVETIGSFISENPETSGEQVFEESEEIPLDSRPFSDDSEKVASDEVAVDVKQKESNGHDVSSESHQSDRDGEKLIEQGISFFSNFLETLRSPEATRNLVETLVREDESTGQKYINIPIKDKKNVTNLLTVLGKLLDNNK